MILMIQKNALQGLCTCCIIIIYDMYILVVDVSIEYRVRQLQAAINACSKSELWRLAMAVRASSLCGASWKVENHGNPQPSFLGIIIHIGV